MKTQAEIKITTFFRDSTQEWIGEIEYLANETRGNSRYTGKTENEARNAAFSAIGYLLLETTFGITE